MNRILIGIPFDLETYQAHTFGVLNQRFIIGARTHLLYLRLELMQLAQESGAVLIDRYGALALEVLPQSAYHF